MLTLVSKETFEAECSSTYWRMEKVIPICVVQYLSQTRYVRLQQKQLAPEAFSVLMIFDILIEINEYGPILLLLSKRYPTLNKSLYSVTIFGSK